MTLPEISYYSGISVVLASHAYILAYGMPQSQVKLHAQINLAAGAAIAYGWMSTRV